VSGRNAAASRITGGGRLALRVTAVLFLALPLTVGPAAIASAESEHDRLPVIEVELSHAGLTVDVRHAPLSRVLEIIGERASVDITLHGDVSAPITESFASLPLEDGIRRLARGHSVVVAYGAPTDESGRAMVTGIWVMASSAAGARGASESAPSFPESSSPFPNTARDGESPLALQTDEIQRLGADAGHGSEAAMLRLAEIVASDGEVALRHQAVAALGRLASPTAEPVLAAALADTDVEVRLRAVRGLRRFGTDTAVQSIAEVSLTDADPHVRLAAVTALTSLPGGSTLRALAKASSDPDDVVRAVAIRGLAWWNTRPPVAH
jgi:HEAT repeat protein